MRLIDADALDIDSFPIGDDEDECVITYENIKNAPTIDAIPVVWLRVLCDIMRRQSSRAAADMLSRVIDLWRQEQEDVNMNVTINNKEFTMRYTVNSLCAIESIAGMPIDRLMDLPFSATRLLLWGGLIEEQPDLTVHAAGCFINDCIAAGDSLEDIVDLRADGLRAAGFLGVEAKGDAQ